MTNLCNYLKKMNPKIQTLIIQPAEPNVISWGYNQIENEVDGGKDIFADKIITMKTQRVMEMSRRLFYEEGLSVGL